MDDEQWKAALGSSPLTRGARCPARRGACDGRLIPADAGSTNGASRPTSVPRAHPR